MDEMRMPNTNFISNRFHFLCKSHYGTCNRKTAKETKKGRAREKRASENDEQKLARVLKVMNKTDQEGSEQGTMKLKL